MAYFRQLGACLPSLNCFSSRQASSSSSTQPPRHANPYDKASPITQAEAVSERGGKKSAILIGVDRYNSDAVHDLQGCVEDVRLVEAYLKTSVGVPVTHIIKLISPATTASQAPPSERLPTLKNVAGALEKLASDAQRNDFVYIHYSGHGTRLPTLFPDLKNHNQDEALLLLGEVERSFGHLRDVEMGFLLSEIAGKGATVTIVLDCCHSGGAIREGALLRGVDGIPTEVLDTRKPLRPENVLAKSWVKQTSDPHRAALVMNHWMTSSTGIEFLAACRANQKAQEIRPSDNKPRGLFTNCLVNVLEDNKQRPRLTCDMIYNLVARKVGAHNPQQDVVFGGQRNRAFSGVERMNQAVTSVTNVTKSADNMRVLVELDAGKAHGVSEGDEFALYLSDKTLQDLIDYNESLAVCRLNEVDDFFSKGLVEYPVQVGFKAFQIRDILRRHILLPRTISISPGEPEVLDQRVQAVKKTIKAASKLVDLRESGSAFFETRVRRSGDFEISFTHNTKTGIKATVNVQSMDHLLSYLDHLVIYYNLLSLSSSSNTSGLSVEISGILPCGTSPPEPKKTDMNESPPTVEGLQQLAISDPQDICEGDSVGIRVRNRGYRPAYIEILDLEPSWEVSRVYPQGEDESPILLEPNETVDFFVNMFISESVPYSVQPETFNAIVILATPSDRCNFPSKILPQLSQTSSWEKTPLSEIGGGRGGKGVSSSKQWFAQRLDFRVVKRSK